MYRNSVLFEKRTYYSVLLFVLCWFSLCGISPAANNSEDSSTVLATNNHVRVLTTDFQELIERTTPATLAALNLSDDQACFHYT